MIKIYFLFAVAQLTFGIVNMFIPTNTYPGITNGIGNIVISGIIGGFSIPIFFWAFLDKKVN